MDDLIWLYKTKQSPGSQLDNISPRERRVSVIYLFVIVYIILLLIKSRQDFCFQRLDYLQCGDLTLWSQYVSMYYYYFKFSHINHSFISFGYPSTILSSSVISFLIFSFTISSSPENEQKLTQNIVCMSFHVTVQYGRKICAETNLPNDSRHKEMKSKMITYD